MIDLHDHERVITVVWLRFKRDTVLLSQRLESSKGIRFHGVLTARAAIVFQQVVPEDRINPTVAGVADG